MDSRPRSATKSSRDFKNKSPFSKWYSTVRLIRQFRRYTADRIATHGLACLDMVLPPTCLLCGDGIDQGDLCTRCEIGLAKTWPALALPCRFCGKPRSKLPVPAFDQSCGGCPPTPYPFDSVTPLGIYQGAIREAVVATKRGTNAALASALGVRLGKSFAQADFAGQIDCVTFVPTHWWRRVLRGGPSAAERMAMAVGKVLNVPTIATLSTTRWVAKQSLLPDEKRELNVRGAFCLKRSYVWQRSSNLRDRHILLVDDVLTTGATAKESTDILKQAGAAKVHLAVVARAVRR
jgi:predicted amidophosphoribosyltransferase